MALRCIYCGLATVHEQRLQRYCTTDGCVQKGRRMEEPRYQSETVTDRTTELEATITRLRAELATSRTEVTQLKSDNSKLQDQINAGFADAYKVYENEISIGRFDCLRAFADMHVHIIRAEQLSFNQNEDVRNCYEQLRNNLERNMTKVGMRTYGTVGERITLSPDTDENNARYESETRTGEIIQIGYETTNGITIQKAKMYNFEKE